MKLQQYFTWNRTHTIAVFCMIAILIFDMLHWMTLIIPWHYGSAITLLSACEVIITCSMLLAIMMLILHACFGSLRSRSMSMPTVSSLVTLLVVVVLALVSNNFSLGIGNAIGWGVLITLGIWIINLIGVWSGYVIGYCLLRPVKNLLQKYCKNTRFCIWVQHHTLLSGCWQALILSYVIMLALLLSSSDGIGIIIGLLVLPFLIMAVIASCAGMLGIRGLSLVITGVILDVLLNVIVMSVSFYVPCNPRFDRGTCLSLGNLSIHTTNISVGVMMQTILPTVIITFLCYAVSWLVVFIYRKVRARRIAQHGHQYRE